MAWSKDDPSSIKDKRINIDVVQDVEQQYLMEMVALQETQEESISVEEWRRISKFDAEKDVDGQDTRGGLTGTVGPEIASRIKLLFGDDQQVSQKTDVMVREGEKGVVVMDRVKEMKDFAYQEEGQEGTG